MDVDGLWIPPDLVIELLSHLQGSDARHVMGVSRLWKSSVLVSRTNVIFSVDSDEEHLDRIHQLDKLFPLAKRLKVVAHPSRPLDSVRFSLSRPLVLPPRLDALELHKLQIDSKALSNLLQTSQLRMFKCCHVEFIDLGRWKHGSTGVTSLYLRDCSFVSVRGLGRQAERRKALGALLKVFQGVQELTLESMELSDGLLGGYLAGLDELTSLNLAGSRGFSHRAISRVQKNKLKELVLSACWVLNDDMCRVICEVCPGLETLGVYEGQISTTTVNLISNLSHLKTLDMGYSDGDVSPIDLQRMLHKLKGLSVLNLGGVGAVNDFVMREIAKMKALKRLDISGCPSLTDEGYKALATLESLEDLSCGWTNKFTDEIIATLPATLEMLDVSYSSQLTDSGLHLLGRLVRLKELKLTNCKGLTNDAVEIVSRRGVRVVS